MTKVRLILEPSPSGQPGRVVQSDPEAMLFVNGFNSWSTVESLKSTQSLDSTHPSS